MSASEEVERLTIAIKAAMRNLESHLDPTRIGGKDNIYVKFALSSLQECVGSSDIDRGDRYDREKPTKDMTAQELVDAFASLYRIHSNPNIYQHLKAGYDEILRRLTEGSQLQSDLAMVLNDNILQSTYITDAMDEKKTIRDLMLQRIQVFREFPYNGEYCFGAHGQFKTDETFESFTNSQLLDVFEQVCRAAYRQR